MGTCYEIGCNKCSFRRSLRVGVGMVHSSLEAEIESTSRKEQQTIKQIISGKQNLISEGEGYSIFQCSTCCAIVNKFHIKIIENHFCFRNEKICYLQISFPTQIQEIINFGTIFFAE